MSFLYTITTLEDGTKVVTVFHQGELLTATSVSHGNIDDIINGLLGGESENVLDLFDLGRAVQKRFERVSERVLLRDGEVLFDGEPVNNALTQQILRFVNEGVEDFMPLVNFFEKIATNPNEHSREQLFRWLDRHDFTIDESGDIVAYKGVRATGDGYTSVHQGPAIVNGEAVKGYVPNPLGAVVEMPRSDVHHDPSQGCSTGLHVGTFEYANSFGDVVLEVRVNPRDVVSVPTDSNDQKVRTCRYTVVSELEKRYESPVLVSEDEDYGDDCDYCWGDCSCDIDE